MLRPRSPHPFIFVASPSDVGAERSAAIAVAKSLCETLPVPVRVEFYEDLTLSAGVSYQPQIPSPADPNCIATICILGEKFGSPITAFPGVPPGRIPPDLLAYCAERSIDVSIDPQCYDHGSTLPLSGTLFEFLEACRGPGEVLLLIKGDRDLLYVAADPMDRGFGLGQHRSHIMSLPGTATANVSNRLGDYIRQVTWLARLYDQLIFRKGAPEPHHIIRSADDLVQETRRWLKGVLRYVRATPEQMFKGAEPFGVGDWPGLFGRDLEVRRFVERLDAADKSDLTAGRRPFLVVCGKSGAGKTSFVRAGVAGSLLGQGALGGRRFAPVFLERDDLGLDQAPPRSDGNAVPRLARALARGLQLPDFADEVERYPPATIDVLLELLDRRLKQHQETSGCRLIPLVVLDQFEDALRLRQIPAYHHAFDDNIATVVEALDRLSHRRLCWSIVCLPNELPSDDGTVRAHGTSGTNRSTSSLTSWRNLEVVRRAVEARGMIEEFTISATSDVFLDEIIRQPFLHLGPGLDDRAYRLVREQLLPITDGDHVPLPLVSVHLSAIYQRWLSRQTALRPIQNPAWGLSSDIASGLASETYGAVTIDDVTALSLEGSIEQLGERALTIFSRQTGVYDTQRHFERLLRQLVDIPARRQNGRRGRVLELNDIGIGGRLPSGITRTEARLAEALLAARLLVRSGPQKVRLAHRCILDYWPRVREWLARDTALLETREDIRLELSYRADRSDPGMMPTELVTRIHQLLVATADTGFLEADEHDGIVMALEQQFARLAADQMHTGYLHAALRARNSRLVAYYLAPENIARINLDASDQSDLAKPPLLVAAEEHHFEAVHRLLSAGANPRLSDEDGRTVLHGLATAADGAAAVAAIKAVLQHLGGDHLARSTVVDRVIRPSNWTCLHLAAAQGATSIVRELLAGGANRLSASRSGQLALHFAVRHGNTELVAALLSDQKHRQIEHVRRDGKTAVMLAAETSNGAVVEMLIAHQAKLSRTDADGSTTLHLAAAVGNVSALAALLKQTSMASAKILNRRNEQGATALMLACRQGHSETVTLLLGAGADPRVRSPDGETALLHACRQPNVLIVQALLGTNKLHLDHANAIGMTALHIAAHYGFDGIVDVLLRAGSPVNPRTDMQRTPLHLAAREGHIVVAERLLVDPSVDTQAQTIQGQTAAHLAAFYGHSGVLELLLRRMTPNELNRQDAPLSAHSLAALTPPAPVEPDDTSEDETTLIVQEMRRRDDGAVVEEVMEGDLSRGSALSGVKGQRTALYSAAQAGRVACVESLLRSGADPRIPDVRGITPLLSAAFAGHTQVAGRLMAALASDLNALRKCDNNLRTLLHAAAVSGDHVLFESALAADAGAIEHEDIFGQTPLVAVAYGLAERTARNRDIDVRGACLIFARLSRLGARPDARGDNGRTALHYAALSGSEAFFTLVWDAYSNLSGDRANGPSPVQIGLADQRGQTPLHFAATGGAETIVKRLLEHGADVAASDRDGFTPLHRAARSGRSQAAIAILQHAISRSSQLVAQILAARSRPYGKSALHCAAEGDTADLIDILKLHGVEIEQRTWLEASTALHIAALNDRANVVRALIAAGAERNARDALGSTPLGGAAKEGNVAALTALLDSGADPNAPGYSGAAVVPSMADHLPGGSALASAAAHGKVEIARILLARGADINHRGRFDTTALHQAAGAKAYSSDMISLLLEKGADPKCVDSRGFTPIHIAAMTGAPETVDNLLERRLYVRGPYRATLVHMAAKAARFDVLQLLKARRQKMTTPDSRGRTGLHYAAESQRPNAVLTIEWLLRHNLSPTARDREKNTAAHLAAKNGRTDVLVALLKRHPQLVAMKNDRNQTPVHIVALRADAKTLTALAKSELSVSGKRALPIHMLVARAAAHVALSAPHKLDPSPAWLQEITTSVNERMTENNWTTVLSAALEFKDVHDDRDDIGRSPLHLACEPGVASVVKTLLKTAPSRLIKSKDKRGHTPMSLALLGQYTAVVNLLQERILAEQHPAATTPGPKPADVLNKSRETPFIAPRPLSTLLVATVTDLEPTFH